MPAPDRKRRLTAFAVAMAVLIATPLAVVAADAFNDVPNSNVHHEDITRLRDNGVTFGCNPPANTEFCPGEPVLRQQMASFMRRLAENEVVNAATANEADHAVIADSATTAGDADTVDGLHAADLGRIAFDSAEASSPSVQFGTHLSTSITAPQAGNLSIVYNAGVGSASGDPDIWGCFIGVDDEFPDAGAGFGAEFQALILGGCTAHLVQPVSAGTHSVEVEVETFVASASFGPGTLSVQFIPFGPTGTLGTAGEGEGRTLNDQIERFRSVAAGSGLGG